MTILKKLIISLIIPSALSFLLYFLSFNSSKDLSFTTDEPSHIARGVMLIRTGDYRINQHHPILFNVLESIPIAYDIDFKGEDLNSDNWKYAKKDDIAMNLVWINGGREAYSLNFLVQARQVSAALSALLLFISYQLVLKLFSFKYAFLSIFLLSLSPTVLAHSSLVTTDVPAMFTIFIATLSLYYDLRKTKKDERHFPWLFTFTALIALLSKYTATLLIPFWVLIYGWVLSHHFKLNSKRVLINCIGIIAVWLFLLTAAYGFKFTTIYEADYGNTGKVYSTYDHIYTIDRILPFDNLPFLDTIYRKVKFPFPEYLKGFYDNVIKHNFHGHKTYLLGHSFNGGNPLYFPVSFLIKETLPFILLSLFSVTYALVLLYKNFKLFMKNKGYYLPLLAIPTVLTFLSLASSINIGVRHLLPIYPFLCLLIAYVVSILIEKYKSRLFILLLTILLTAHLLVVIRAFTNYLEYFNEITGGTKNGYLYLHGSNLDWQQERFYQENKQAELGVESYIVYPKEDISSNSKSLSTWQRCLRYKYFKGDVKPESILKNHYFIFRVEDKKSLCVF